MFLIGFPLLLIPFAIYNIIAFFDAGRELDRPAHHRAYGVGRRLVDRRPATS